LVCFLKINFFQNSCSAIVSKQRGLMEIHQTAYYSIDSRISVLSSSSNYVELILRRSVRQINITGYW
jgi:hypothetical protein